MSNGTAECQNGFFTMCSFFAVSLFVSLILLADIYFTAIISMLFVSNNYDCTMCDKTQKVNRIFKFIQTLNKLLLTFVKRHHKTPPISLRVKKD